MAVRYERCCGLDVHKHRIVACRISPEKGSTSSKQIRSFGTAGQELSELGRWLGEAGITHVAMESTGPYSTPVYQLLAQRFQVLVVHPPQVAIPKTRKTDVLDAQRIAELLQQGLLQGSFIPSGPQRELRDLTRRRATVVHQRVRVLHRIHNLLDGANIRLSSVMSDIASVSGRKVLAAMAKEDHPDASELAELALGRLRPKREQLKAALAGTLQPHQRFLLGQLIRELDFCDDLVEGVDEQILRLSPRFDREMRLLATIPGINRRAAQVVVAEIGADLTRFPTSKHLAGWTGLSPGVHQSGKKRWVKHTRTRRGNVYLRQILMNAALVVSKTKSTYLGSRHRRLASRIGQMRALVATARAIVVAIYHVLTHGEPYKEPDPHELALSTAKAG